MCGIAGFLNIVGHREIALAVNDLQKRRGPDAQGVWSTDQLSLSHQRLSIIDLSERSNQPFRKNGFTIVFNGEIYNYKKLKGDLESAGAAFNTDSDTEVVLEAFRAFGPQCLDRLKGMFAFAIWNEQGKSLFLARDAFGIKPLYFYKRGQQFAFASELKTLAAVLPVERRVSPAGLAALLTYLWLPPEFCILEGFASVPPAHYATVDGAGNLSIKKWWELPSAAASDVDEDEWTDRLESALTASIERHLVADVEVGAFLSGGLDSSLICAMAANKVKRLRTFTIAIDDKARKVERMSSDELYSRKVAERLSTDHREITIQPNLVVELAKIMDAVDEPIGDPAIINTRLICSGARDAGIKVLLSGMGADEIFFGYRRQKAWLYAQRYQRLPRPVRDGIRGLVGMLPVRVGGTGLRSIRWAKKFLSFADLGGEARYQSSFSYYAPQQLKSLLNPEWRHGVDQVQENFRHIYEQWPASDPINRLCYTDTRLFLPGLNLAYTDRASMAASTEVRVPFVDRDVVELAMSIPGRLKFHRGRSKYLLKRVAERHLPREIVHRPKASFGAPLRAWISGELKPMVDDLLSTERLERRGWVSPVEFRKVIDADRAGRVDHSYQIYQLLVLELWAQRTLDPHQPSHAVQ